jgi:hypothetical protein
MTNEQQQSPKFCLDKLKKHLYNTIWGIKQLLTVGKANDTNGHPSQESDVTVDAENSNVDEPANGDPRKDPDHTFNAENMSVNEPDCTLDSMEVNTVCEANDTNGYPSQESDVTVNAENINVDEPDIIDESSKIIDTNAEQTESIVDDDVEHNNISPKTIASSMRS